MVAVLRRPLLNSKRSVMNLTFEHDALIYGTGDAR